MIDILSLPKRNLLYHNIGHQNIRSGLPINSLPGWEQIPLNSKLPMLKCPGNQVIFSKNKIGQSLRTVKQEFDSSVTDYIPEYNALDDINLRTFYSNERNLKRLRENGEITQNNDVICNLKDFNSYRQELHKAQLYYVLQAYKQREAEQNDRTMIANAENIAKRDLSLMGGRHQCQEEIMARKQRLEAERHQRFVLLASITEEKFKRLKSLATMQQAVLEHRKMITNLRIKEHIDMCEDLQRKHLIKLKKLFQYKKARFNRNMRRQLRKRLEKTTEGQIQSWQNRLDERIANQRRIDDLLEDIKLEREDFIEEHKERYHIKWERIQEEIRERSRVTMLARQPKRRKRKPKPVPVRATFCDEYQESFNGLLDSELCFALNTAIAIEGSAPLTFNNDDPIYKAAQYILNHILKGSDQDLSDDLCAVAIITDRMEQFLCDGKKYVHSKATQIINFARDNKEIDGGPLAAYKLKAARSTTTRTSHVSFRGDSCTIGVSSYEIHPFVDVRACSDRRPTPAGSLASLVVSQIGEQLIQDKVRLPHMTRNEIVFIEHYIVKFKRELLVNVDKQVFASIQCHFENKMMGVREELLELDKRFLLDQIAKGILSYAVNPLNYETSLRLAVNVIASEIIWQLQQTLLIPGIKPRGITHPTSCFGGNESFSMCPFKPDHAIEARNEARCRKSCTICWDKTISTLLDAECGN